MAGGSKAIRNAALLRDRGLCCNCSQTADQVHHIVPLSRGGRDVLSNVASLCADCHGQAHGMELRVQSRLAIERTQASVAHRRATGGDLGGRRPSYTPQQQELALRLRAEGQSLREIALAVGVSKGTAHRMVGSTQEVV
jgi:DNA-binding NarL/FixJ family response regulator